MKNDLKDNVPIWEKVTLTFEEANAYSGIGINKLRKLATNPNCDFVIHIGNRTLIKRKKFETYLSQKTVIN